MVKKVTPIFNDTYDDEEVIEPLKIKSTYDILNHYSDATTEDEIQLVHDAIVEFDVETKISEYNELLYNLYKDVVEVWIYDNAPTHIFDTGLHNSLMVNFIDYVYKNTIKGMHLDIIYKIYTKYLEKRESDIWNNNHNAVKHHLDDKSSHIVSV